SAFITTTVHDPSVGSHTTLCAPAPVADATQNPCAPGADTGLPPPTARTLSPQKSEITVRPTPARQRSTPADGPTPTNTADPPAPGLTRIRTLSNRVGEYSHPAPADPNCVGSVASADPAVENRCTSLVAYPASRWVRSAHNPVPPLASNPNETKTSTPPTTTPPTRPPAHPPPPPG